MEIYHTPVLTKEIIENLYISPNSTNIIDCTLGEGGISKSILDNLDDINIIGIDTDKSILDIAKKRLAKYKTITYMHDNYINISKCKKSFNIESTHNIIFDFGLSNYHLRNTNKAFSFDSHNILDMRFNENDNLNAHKIINEYNKQELKEILIIYADFPNNANTDKLLQYIIQNRPIDTCENLKKICLNFHRNLPYKRALQNITRIFQAIRIEVNNEFENIKNGLDEALSAIDVKGKVFAITYHSGEDKIVKKIFRDYKFSTNIKKYNIVNKKVIKPKYEEQKSNPNSRSAKLRIIERIL